MKARPLAPSPRLRERVGERGPLHDLRRSESCRGPLTRRFAPTSPRKRGEVEPAALCLDSPAACGGSSAWVQAGYDRPASRAGMARPVVAQIGAAARIVGFEARRAVGDRIAAGIRIAGIGIDRGRPVGARPVIGSGSIVVRTGPIV